MINELVELQKRVSELKTVNSSYKYDQEKLATLENILTAFNELKSLGFDIELKKSEEGIYFIDFPSYHLRSHFSQYLYNKSYEFSLTYHAISNYYQTKTEKPNKVTIGKASKKKIQAWLEWAVSETLKRMEFNELANKQKEISLMKIAELKNIPGVKFSDYSKNQDNTQGCFITDNFQLRYNINEAGHISTELKLGSSKYNSEDLFADLAKAGF